MYFSLGFLYIALLILSSSFTIYIWKKHKMSAFGILNASFILYYIVIPSLLILFSSFFSANLGRFTFFIYSSTFEQQLFGFLLTVIAYFVIIITYFLVNGISSKRNQIDILYKFDLNNSIKYISRWGFFLFFIGIISIILFFYELGGLREALSLSNTLRGLGSIPEKYYGATGAVFRMLSFMILGAAYCMKIYSDYSRMILTKVFLWISYFFSAIYLLFNAGRMPIIFFLLPFILDGFYKKNKNPIMYLFILFVGAALIAQTFDMLLLAISINDISIIQSDFIFKNSIIDVMQDLSFPYSNILLLDPMIESAGIRYGLDYFVWITNILPSRLFGLIGINLPEVVTINTITSMFYFEFSPSRGGVPTDLITFGMRQMKVVGVVLNTFLFTLLALHIDKFAQRTRKEFSLLVTSVNLLFFSIVSNSDITAIVRNTLYIIILYFILRRVSRVTKASVTISKSV